MATINLTYTAPQAAAVQSAVTRYNQSHGTSLNAAQYIQLKFSDLLDSVIADQSQRDKGQLADAWANASPATQTQIKGLLGIS
jgi:hypothetical protein